MTLEQQRTVTPTGSKPRQYPTDRFDAVPRSDRVGAHRLTGRVRRFWRYALVAVIATAVLVTAGIFWVNSIGGSSGLSTEQRTAPQAEQTKPVLDPEATVAVLNGTEVPNLAAGVDEVITRNSWGQIIFSGEAAAKDVEISAVFYADPADEAAAMALAAELGGVSTYESQSYLEYGVRLVVLLGSDYAGPGEEEAAAITARADGEPVAIA